MTYSLTIAMTPADADTAARTVWGEARGEPFEGKVAVMWVIRNRAERPRWWSRNPDNIPDDTVEAVCKDPLQFSAWNPSDPNSKRLPIITFSTPQFPECLTAVAGVLSGNCPDPTGGADSYHTIQILPAWAENRHPTVVIGNHAFYRLEG